MSLERWLSREMFSRLRVRWARWRRLRKVKPYSNQIGSKFTLWVQVLAVVAMTLLTGALVFVNFGYLQELKRVTQFQRGAQAPYIEYMDAELKITKSDSSIKHELVVTNKSASSVLLDHIIISIRPYEEYGGVIRRGGLEYKKFKTTCDIYLPRQGFLTFLDIPIGAMESKSIDVEKIASNYKELFEELKAVAAQEATATQDSPLGKYGLILTVRLYIQENLPPPHNKRRFEIHFYGTSSDLSGLKKISAFNYSLLFFYDDDFNPLPWKP